MDARARKLLQIARPGDLIGFSGSSFISNAINIFTLGIPRESISHVGIIFEREGRLLILEALATPHPFPDAIDDRPDPVGITAHKLEDCLFAPEGLVWHYPLSCKLYQHQSVRLTNLATALLGRPYDKVGAAFSAGYLFSLLASLVRGEDARGLFCSETVALIYKRLGIWRHRNASSWSPNALVRHLRIHGFLDAPTCV